MKDEIKFLFLIMITAAIGGFLGAWLGPPVVEWFQSSSMRLF